MPLNNSTTIYRDKEEFMTKANLQKMGQDAKQELEGKNWEERYDWIVKNKEDGNKHFKN